MAFTSTTAATTMVKMATSLLARGMVNWSYGAFKSEKAGIFSAGLLLW